MPAKFDIPWKVRSLESTPKSRHPRDSLPEPDNTTVRRLVSTVNLNLTRRPEDYYQGMSAEGMCRL